MTYSLGYDVDPPAIAPSADPAWQPSGPPPLAPSTVADGIGSDTVAAGTPSPVYSDDWMADNRAPLLNLLDASQRSAMYGSRTIALSDAIDARNATIQSATGVSLKNPVQNGYQTEALQSYADANDGAQPDFANADQMQVLGDLRRKIYDTAVAQIQQQRPDIPGLDQTPEQLGQALSNQADADLTVAQSRYGGFWNALPVTLAGGFAGTLRDPISLMSYAVPVGGELKAASTLGRVVEGSVHAAAMNAGITALMEPSVQQYRAERGQQTGLLPAADDIGTAALFGLPFGAAGALLHGGAHASPAAMGDAVAGDAAAAGRLADAIPATLAPDLHAVVAAHALDTAAVADMPADIRPQDGAQAAREAIRFGEDPDTAPLPHLPPAVPEGTTDDLARQLTDGASPAQAIATLHDDPDALASALSSDAPDLRMAGRLASLSPEALDRVDAGVLRPEFAQHVAATVPDPVDHAAMIDAVAREAPATQMQARAAITREMQHTAAPDAAAQLLGAGDGAADRAAAQGFTYEGIHATQADFENFDLTKVGGTSDPGALGEGIYFAPHPDAGETYEYGRLDGQRQIAARIRMRRPFEILSHLTDGNDLRFEGDFAALKPHGYAHDTIPGMVDGLMGGQRGDDPANARAFTQALRGAGYDGVVMHYVADGVKRLEELMSFDTKNIRSRYDRFDPRAANDDGLLASQRYAGVPENDRPSVPEAATPRETPADAAAQVAQLEGAMRPEEDDLDPIVAVGQKVQGQAARRPNRPQSLLAFLRQAGGIMDQGGELRAREYHRQFPGLMNNKTGLPLDRAREMAAEAGYLGGDTERAVSNTGINDLLDALANHPVYSVHDADRVLAADADRAAATSWSEHQNRVASATEELHRGMESEGVPPLDPDLAERVANRMVETGEPWEVAVDRTIMDTELPEPEATHLDDDIPFEDAAPDSGGAPREGAGVPAEGGDRAGRDQAGDPGAMGDAPGDRDAAGRTTRSEGGDEQGLTAGDPPIATREPQSLFDAVPIGDLPDGADTAYSTKAALMDDDDFEQLISRLVKDCKL